MDKNILLSFIVFVTLFLSCNSTPVNPESENLGDLIDIILAKLDTYFVQKDVNYTPPFKWAEKAGLYRSNIRINLVGDPIMQDLRNGELTSIFDNDMFSTGWIVTTLLDAILYGKAVAPFAPRDLNMSLIAMNDFKNRNEKNVNQTIIRTFWPQTYNSTYNIWQQQPINIRNVILNVEALPWDAIEKFLKSIKLNKLVDWCEQIRQMGKEGLDAFSIPPDFDDTYLNLGMGATLDTKKIKMIFPGTVQSWLNNNTDVQSLIDATVKYAYRPFDSDPNKNLIDPRTYFYARHFIQDAYKNNQPLALVSTWIQNLEEQRTLKTESVSMPFNTNNVDVTVGANSIYGMTSGSISNVNDFGTAFLANSDIQQIYLNTTRFISWTIKANFSSRPDLAQVYYPSTYNFLWYASRTLFLLECENQKYMYLMKQNNLINNAENAEKIAYIKRFRALKPVFDEARLFLQDAFETSATDDLMQWKRNDGNPNEMYFCDFLGMNDTDMFGHPTQTKDDCVFSTAQAINILIATWTYQDPQSLRLIYKPGTPKSVNDLIDQSITWLKANVMNNKYKKLNAFFSGSVKGFSTLPFWYPINYLQYLNGTIVPESDIPDEDLEMVIAGVSGVIDEDTYQKLLTQKHFGYPTPLDFDGYNIKENIFPFWASEPYTYSVAILALSQYLNLIH